MYRTVASSFWTDPKVKTLPPDGKCLLLYLITNPHTHVSGIYVLARPVIQLETGMARYRIDTLSHTLSGLGFCTFDPTKDVVWVKNMLNYQGRGEKNLRSAAAHVVEDLHNSFLCQQFLEFYPGVKQFVPKAFLDALSRYPIDRVSEFGTPVPVPDPDPRSRSPIPNQDQDRDMEPPAEKRGGRPPDSAFELFVAVHQEVTGAGYVHKKGDFVQLATLRKANHLGTQEVPDGWDTAVRNYFASPLPAWTLADLCIRFPTLRNSPLNEFRTPIAHHNRRNGNGSRESEAEARQRRTDAAADGAVRQVAEEIGGAVSRGTGAEDGPGLSGGPRRLPK